MAQVLTVRAATADDEAGVVALWRACGLVTSYNDPAADFTFALAGASSNVLVGENDGRLRAGAMVGHDGHRGWLYYVAADPGCRGAGFGRQIVAAGEDWLRARGVAKVQLLVRETNAQVVGFYQRLGFDITPRIVLAKWLAP